MGKHEDKVTALARMIVEEVSRESGQLDALSVSDRFERRGDLRNDVQSAIRRSIDAGTLDVDADMHLVPGNRHRSEAA